LAFFLNLLLSPDRQEGVLPVRVIDLKLEGAV